MKVDNFKNSDNKRAYFYLLIPRGMDAKAKISVQFFSAEDGGVRVSADRD